MFTSHETLLYIFAGFASRVRLCRLGPSFIERATSADRGNATELLTGSRLEQELLFENYKLLGNVESGRLLPRGSRAI